MIGAARQPATRISLSMAYPADSQVRLPRVMPSLRLHLMPIRRKACRTIQPQTG